MSKSLRAFNVYLTERNKTILLDVVFYNASDKITAEEVKESLVNHDGYAPDIEVIEDK